MQLKSPDDRQVELKRDLTTFQSYATIIGMLVGSGIFVVTGEAGAVAGPSVPLGYLVLAPVILATAAAYAVYLSTPLGTKPGDAYLHISRTIQSYYVGFLALWLKWLAYIGALVILSISLGKYLKFFYPELDRSVAALLPGGDGLMARYVAGPTLGEAVIATIALLFFFGFNVIGVKFYGGLQTAMFVFLVIAIVVLVVPGLFAIDIENFSPLFPLGFWTSGAAGGEVGFLAALPSLFFAYAGFEGLAQTAGETKEARHALPRVFINGVLISMVIFFLMSAVAFGVMPYQELAKSRFAMSDVAARFLPSWGGAVVTLGALMAFTTSLNATLYVPARILYIFGEDRLLPSALARVSPRFRTPWVSLIVNTGIALVLLWSKSFSFVLNIALAAMFLLYGLHSASLITLPFLRPELYRTAEVRLRPWLLVALGAISVGSMAYLAVVTIGRDVYLQSTLPPEERGIQIWQLLLVWIAVGTLVYLVGRLEGRRQRVDYKQQLRDWEDR